jgi:putative transposase
MPQKKHKPEEIVAKLRQVDVLLSQGRPVAEAIRAISVTPFTYYRWRKEFGGLKSDQVKRLKDLEKENERLRKAVSDLTLEKLILREAASGNFQAPAAVAAASITSGRSSTCRSGRRAACWGSIARPKEKRRRVAPMMRPSPPTSSRSPRSTAAMATAGSRHCCRRPAGR